MNLRVCNASKKIGRKFVLKNVDLNLTNGNIYGFVGQNGSGKTMLFRAISGIIKLTSGEIFMDEKKLHGDLKVLPGVGIILENAGLYQELTGVENLKHLASINKKIGEYEIFEAIERVGLKKDDKRTYRKYSLGMKQRILLAQAIMEKPEILILDEPTNGLDEEGKELLRNILKEEKARGALILIASHDKEDIKLLADKVFSVKDGIVTEG